MQDIPKRIVAIPNGYELEKKHIRMVQCTVGLVWNVEYNNISKGGVFLDSLTIRRKLFLVFGVLLAIFLASSLYAGYSLNSINSGALRIATEHLGSVMTAMESSQSLANYRQGEFSVVTAKSLPARLYAARDNKNCAAQIDIALDALAPAVAPEVKDDFDALRRDWDAYKADSGYPADGIGCIHLCGAAY